ncbi:MAG: hypothetical protein ACRC14_14140, partial [Paracoccaceae bacterium]
MSASNCIAAKAAAGKVSKARGKAATDRIKEIREALISGGEPPGSAASMAETQYGVELKGDTARQRWRMVNNVRVRKQLTDAVAARPDKLGRMAIKMVDDLDFDARSIHKQVMGRVGAFLEKTKPTLLGKVSAPAEWNDILGGLQGENVKSPNARRMVDAINDANEYLRKKLNSYGFSIGKLDGWGVPHSHSASSIGSAGNVRWKADIDARLDWAGMINGKTGMPFGTVPSAKFRDEYLQAVYENIVYGRDSKNPQWAKSVEGGGMERHRELKFKSSADWLEYNKKYGSA